MAKAARASPVFDVCFFLLVFAVVDHLWLYFARFWSVHNVQAIFFTFIKTHLHPELPQLVPLPSSFHQVKKNGTELLTVNSEPDWIRLDRIHRNFFTDS